MADKVFECEVFYEEGTNCFVCTWNVYEEYSNVRFFYTIGTPDEASLDIETIQSYNEIFADYSTSNDYIITHRYDLFYSALSEYEQELLNEKLSLSIYAVGEIEESTKYIYSVCEYRAFEPDPEPEPKPEPIKISCLVDYNDSWLQSSDSWELKKTFILTWEVALDSTETISEQNFGYQYDDNTICYPTEGLTVSEVGNRKIYTYIINAPQACSKFTTHAYIKTVAGNEYSDYKSIDLIAPPAELKNVQLKKLSSNKFRCSWDTVPGVDGYCLSIYRKKENEDKFSLVPGLSLDVDSNWIKQDATSTEVEVLDEVELVLGDTSPGSDLYLDKEITEVYFNPVDFNFDKKDIIKVLVYPYVIYSRSPAIDEDGNLEYDENDNLLIEPSALLTNEGKESEPKPLASGIVRIKTSSGWREGQVWVKTTQGWKEATGVYTKTDKGWKESI